MDVPVRFADRVWIGNIYAARNISSLLNRNIATVLTCGSLSLPWCPCADDESVFMDTVTIGKENQLSSAEHEHTDSVTIDGKVPYQITHLRLEWEDCSEAELKSHLQKTIKFISERLAAVDTDVLIHCWAGQCRSATAAVAYLASVSDKSIHQCYAELTRKYPRACISSAFLRQLHHFHLESRAALCVGSNNNGTTVEELDGVGADNKPGTAHPEDAQYFYSCKICRAILFYDTDVIPCDATSKAKQQRFGKQGKGFAEKPKEQCGSLFVDELNWIPRTSSETGKLLCRNPDCQYKLGGFSWYGLRCSCGAWQTPGFQVNKGRVDKFAVDRTPS